MPANDRLYTSTDSILRTIALVKAVLDNHSIQHKIGVYSEGNSADFGEICIPGVELLKYRVNHYSVERVRHYSDAPSTIERIVDIDAISATQELIEADILIMSKSSTSYCAALISDGIKIYEPTWRWEPMMEDWLLRSPDGSFDTAALEHQLSFLLRAKTTICKKRQLEGRPQAWSGTQSHHKDRT